MELMRESIMPWRDVSLMDVRAEFVRLAGMGGANRSELCRRFGISRKTGYKWLERSQAGADLADRSRCPATSPGRTAVGTEALVVGLRREHPSWGGRKLRRRLQDLGHGEVPAASTITAILARHGCLENGATSATGPMQRFEHDRPNALWQMDFKGHFPHRQGRCHPLTVLDDHSRYAVCLQACDDETTLTVQDRLIAVFRRFGLPERINMDNGAPWGHGAEHRWTPLTVWLTHLGVRTSHSRPYHPQTNGKDERFHRTLKRDVLHGRSFAHQAACQDAFDQFRDLYNAKRPHEALGMAVPASRYRASPRSYPEALPTIDYDPTDETRRVQTGGWISFRGREHALPKAFAGHTIALRPTTTDGLWDVIFIAHRIAQIDLRDPVSQDQPVTHVPEQV
jgi:transposase InsO family protein